jgi:hypothetical protein
LVQANSPLYLLGAETINSSGEIGGFGVTSGGDIHAYVATPGGHMAADDSLLAAPQSLPSPVALPESVREQFLTRWGIRGR